MVAVLPLSLLLLLASATGASARAFSAFRSNDTDATLGREIQKRYSDARFTYFDTGLGACGGTNVASDFIVALNSDQYGGGEDCYKMIEITYNGKSAQAQIVDECPGCPYAGLDFSTGLFTHFAPESVGASGTS
ncbi:hypothetical protein HMN09_00061900 [Mycena chlorophos]|uniref:Expansin family protein n=1 Tax=Mycena chlorophos TaxID=658473 RepID=A0A8H6TW46_MYCCL|nr:hypothetical protein HMN09_00061900 [Mycena chlorophos]